MKDIPNSLAVFCLATYGEGDPTDNALDFYEWLLTGDTDLHGLNYAVNFLLLAYHKKLPSTLNNFVSIYKTWIFYKR